MTNADADIRIDNTVKRLYCTVQVLVTLDFTLIFLIASSLQTRREQNQRLALVAGPAPGATNGRALATSHLCRLCSQCLPGSQHPSRVSPSYPGCANIMTHFPHTDWTLGRGRVVSGQYYEMGNSIGKLCLIAPSHLYNNNRSFYSLSDKDLQNLLFTGVK